VDQKSGLNMSLPQEHCRHACCRDVGRELGQVDLVQEELLPIYCQDHLYVTEVRDDGTPDPANWDTWRPTG
jgi:hypothetical protein